jgi:hypothetical protein
LGVRREGVWGSGEKRVIFHMFGRKLIKEERKIIGTILQGPTKPYSDTFFYFFHIEGGS